MFECFWLNHALNTEPNWMKLRINIFVTWININIFILGYCYPEKIAGTGQNITRCTKPRAALPNPNTAF